MHSWERMPFQIKYLIPLLQPTVLKENGPGPSSFSLISSAKTKFLLVLLKEKNCEYDVLTLHKGKYERHFFSYFYIKLTLSYFAET